MGHSEISMTLNGYSQSWWDERVNAVSLAVAAVFSAPAAKPPVKTETASDNGNAEWVPFWGCPDANPNPTSS